MDEVEHAARAVHHVEVEFARQPLPQLERKFVEVRVRIEVIVGTHDGRVAAGVATAEPPFLDHGDVGQAMLLGEVVRRREPVAASTDDDGIVTLLRRPTAPCEGPVLVVRDGIAREGEYRVLHEGRKNAARRRSAYAAAWI